MTLINVIKPFIYPINNKPQWIKPETHKTFELPTHAAHELIRQGKAKISINSDQDKSNG